MVQKRYFFFIFLMFFLRFGVESQLFAQSISVLSPNIDNAIVIYRGSFRYFDTRGRPQGHFIGGAPKVFGEIMVSVRYSGKKITVNMQGDNNLNKISFDGSRDAFKCSASKTPQVAEDSLMLCSFFEFSGYVNHPDSAPQSGQLFLSTSIVEARTLNGEALNFDPAMVRPPLPDNVGDCFPGYPCPMPKGSGATVGGYESEYYRYAECKRYEYSIDNMISFEQSMNLFNCYWSSDRIARPNANFWYAHRLAIDNLVLRSDPLFPWFRKERPNKLVEGKDFFQVSGFPISVFYKLTGVIPNGGAYRFPFEHDTTERDGKKARYVVLPICTPSVELCNSANRFNLAFVWGVHDNSLYSAQRFTDGTNQFCKFRGALKNCSKSLPNEFSAGQWSYENLDSRETMSSFLGSVFKWSAFTPATLAEARRRSRTGGILLLDLMDEMRADCDRQKKYSEFAVC